MEGDRVSRREVMRAAGTAAVLGGTLRSAVATVADAPAKLAAKSRGVAVSGVRLIGYPFRSEGQ